MEFLAMLYTVLLVAICLMLALLLYRGNKPRRGGETTRSSSSGSPSSWKPRPNPLSKSRLLWRSRTIPPSAA